MTEETLEQEELRLVLLRLLVAEMRNRQFGAYFFPNVENPEIMAYVHHWHRHKAADVVVIRGAMEAYAYRAIMGPGDDLFAPKILDYFFTGPANWAIRAIYMIAPPGAESAPRDQRRVNVRFIPDKYRRQYSMKPQKRVED